MRKLAYIFLIALAVFAAGCSTSPSAKINENGNVLAATLYSKDGEQLTRYKVWVDPNMPPELRCQIVEWMERDLR